MPDQGPTPPHRLAPGAAVLAGVLLAIPCVALALVPTYSRRTPILFGWPFFYWYQVLWVLITPVLTCSAFLVIKHARRQR